MWSFIKIRNQPPLKLHWKKNLTWAGFRDEWMNRWMHRYSRRTEQRNRTRIRQTFWNNNTTMILCEKFHQYRTSTSLRFTLTKNLSLPEREGRTDERTNWLTHRKTVCISYFICRGIKIYIWVSYKGGYWALREKNNNGISDFFTKTLFFSRSFFLFRDKTECRSGH